MKCEAKPKDPAERSEALYRKMCHPEAKPKDPAERSEALYQQEKDSSLRSE